MLKAAGFTLLKGKRLRAQLLLNRKSWLLSFNSGAGGPREFGKGPVKSLAPGSEIWIHPS